MGIKMYRVKWLGVNINLTIIVPFILLSASAIYFFWWMGW